MLENILPLSGLIAHMIENRIQHDLHPTQMSLLHQLTESFLVPKVSINFKVIRRIVLVITWRFKDGTEVKPCNAQVLQIIQMLNNPL